MFLESIHGVVVSDGYDDYLDISLSHNRPMLGRCVVVTSTTDHRSQLVAGKHNCDLIVTDDGRRSDGSFNKGAMIERGLQQLPEGGWRIHFDADIVFPGNLRQRLEPALYDKEAIYGADRMDVIGEQAWQRVIDAGWTARGFEFHHFLSYAINGAKIGARLIYGEHGWVPIGFFQMWHSSVEYTGVYRTKSYPVSSYSAAHDDVQFALRWDRKKRILIPEFLVAHLLTSDAQQGANWKGRKTARWGGGLKPPAFFQENSAGKSCVS